LPTYTLPTSRGSKIDKNCQNWTPHNRCLLYSSVYIFRSERSAPRPPILGRFLKKVQPICGEWTFYKGHLWGSKIGKFLQKSGKFQKIYVFGSGVPEVEIYRFLSLLTPPSKINFRPLFIKFITGQFWVDFWWFLTSHFVNL
jgi:hypothetical protein